MRVSWGGREGTNAGRGGACSSDDRRGSFAAGARGRGAGLAEHAPMPGCFMHMTRSAWCLAMAAAWMGGGTTKHTHEKQNKRPPSSRRATTRWRARRGVGGRSRADGGSASRQGGWPAFFFAKRDACRRRLVARPLCARQAREREENRRAENGAVVCSRRSRSLVLAPRKKRVDARRRRKGTRWYLSDGGAPVQDFRVCGPFCAFDWRCL